LGGGRSVLVPGEDLGGRGEEFRHFLSKKIFQLFSISTFALEIRLERKVISHGARIGVGIYSNFQGLSWKYRSSYRKTSPPDNIYLSLSHPGPLPTTFAPSNLLIPVIQQTVLIGLSMAPI
jgi:hypothetical protein